MITHNLTDFTPQDLVESLRNTKSNDPERFEAVLKEVERRLEKHQHLVWRAQNVVNCANPSQDSRVWLIPATVRLNLMTAIELCTGERKCGS